MAARRRYTKTDYVETFPRKVQEGIRNALNRRFRTEYPYYTPGERRYWIEVGMEGRLADLKDLINIDYWLAKANGKK